MKIRKKIGIELVIGLISATYIATALSTGVVAGRNDEQVEPLRLFEEVAEVEEVNTLTHTNTPTQYKEEDKTKDTPDNTPEQVQLGAVENNVYSGASIGGNGLLEHTFTQNDINLLASLIQSEAGNNASSDELQQWVGQVVMNRVASDLFPNTMYDVIHQKGQYSTAKNLKTPTERALKNAEIVLRGESNCPRDVIWQANFKQGIVVRVFPDKTLGTSMYFGKKK